MNLSDRTCAHHEGVAAIAVCTQCEGDICGECHGVDLRGLAVCAKCRGDRIPLGPPWELESAGPTPRGFAQTVSQVLMAPRSFFQRVIPRKEWGPAAVFGVICVAFGSLFNTLWQKAFSPEYAELLERYHDDFGIAPQGIELLLFASIPVGAVFLYFFHTALLYLTLKVFAVKGTNWPMVARITGYSLAAYLLLIFPPIGEFSLGHFLMILWLFNLEVTAVRWYFGLGFWKSMGVVLLPMMMFLMAGG